MQLTGFTGVGFGIALLGRGLFGVSFSPSVLPKSTLAVFEFTIVAVNSKGQKTKQQQNKAQFFKQDLGNQVNLEMVMISGGAFWMGSPETEQGRERSETLRHNVSVPAFWMSKYQITQEQWQAIAALPKVNRDLDPAPAYFKGANRPIEQVSWKDAVEFCDRLTQKTRRQYRLPSEAEWEYACRAKTVTPFHFGETITSALANYNGRYFYGAGSTGVYRAQTIDVGSFSANAFGLYDMHGNVWEWCLDYWHDSYTGSPVDGSAWTAGKDTGDRLLRGGSWYSKPERCRSADRLKRNLDNRHESIGFRIVCSSA